MRFQKGQAKIGGRTKGTPNKRKELQELLDAVFAQVDPVEKIVSLLNRPMDSGTEARVLLRLMEYAYGQPVQRIEHSGADGGPLEHTIKFGGGNGGTNENPAA